MEENKEWRWAFLLFFKSSGPQIQIFLGVFLGELDSCRGLSEMSERAHARACWQEERIHHAQPCSSPLLAPWPSLITPHSRNSNVSGPPADPYTCRHAQIMHISSCLLRFQTCTFLILTTVISLTDAYAPPPPLPPPSSCCHSQAGQNFNPWRAASSDCRHHGEL